MKRTFSLSPVLRVREQKEQAEERALLAINADLQDVRAAILRVEQETARFGTLREQMTRDVISAAHHQMLALQWQSLREAHGQLHSRLHALKAKQAEQQKLLLLARKDREIVSELREQHTDRLETEATKSERKRMDDLFSSRHGRAIAEAGRRTAVEKS